MKTIRNFLGAFLIAFWHAIKEFIRLEFQYNKNMVKWRDTEYECAAEGFGLKECFGYETKAHIITRKIASLKSDDRNIIKICKGHEAWFNVQDPVVWFRWVRENYPTEFEFVYQSTKGIKEEIETMKTQIDAMAEVAREEII